MVGHKPTYCSPCRSFLSVKIDCDLIHLPPIHRAPHRPLSIYPKAALSEILSEYLSRRLDTRLALTLPFVCYHRRVDSLNISHQPLRSHHHATLPPSRLRSKSRRRCRPEATRRLSLTITTVDSVGVSSGSTRNHIHPRETGIALGGVGNCKGHNNITFYFRRRRPSPLERFPIARITRLGSFWTGITEISTAATGAMKPAGEAHPFSGSQLLRASTADMKVGLFFFLFSRDVRGIIPSIGGGGFVGRHRVQLGRFLFAFEGNDLIDRLCGFIDVTGLLYLFSRFGVCCIGTLGGTTSLLRVCYHGIGLQGWSHEIPGFVTLHQSNLVTPRCPGDDVTEQPALPSIVPTYSIIRTSAPHNQSFEVLCTLLGHFSGILRLWKSST